MEDPCLVSVRMERELKEKVKFLARRDLRSVAGHIRQLVKQNVREYEATNGPIETKQALTLR